MPSNEIKRLRRSRLDLVNFTDKSPHPFIRISNEDSQTVEIWGAIAATIHQHPVQQRRLRYSAQQRSQGHGHQHRLDLFDPQADALESPAGTSALMQTLDRVNER